MGTVVIENPNPAFVVVKDSSSQGSVTVSNVTNSVSVTGDQTVVVTETVYSTPIDGGQGDTVVISSPAEFIVQVSAQGPQGPRGIGVPEGGQPGDLIVKTVDATAWTDAPTVDMLTFDTTAGEVVGEGQVAWNAIDGTLDIGMTGGNVTLQVGQEQLIRVRNNTGVQIANGQVLYVTGALGQRMTVSLASSLAEITSSKTIGVATEDIPNNSEGYITTMGLVRGIATNAFEEGDALYLSSTPGAFTNIKPDAPEHMVSIGWVIKKAGGGAGSIFVHIQNGFEFYELHDVLFTTPKDGDVVQYDGLTQLWKNGSGGEKSPSFSYTAGLLTRVDYDGGNYKTLTYTAGVLTQVVYTLPGRTITKVFAYNPDGSLASINQSETYN